MQDTIVSFQYISDIHLEFSGNLDHFKPIAPYLILAGDIGHVKEKSYVDFIHKVATWYDKVFIVCGNHEYYHATSMHDLEVSLRQMLPKNAIYLQNEVYVFPESNLRIFGGTFWSDIPVESEPYVQAVMNDYKCIPGFTPELSRELHKTAVATLEQRMREGGEDMRWVVISHHMPRFDLIDEKYKSYTYMNYAFASDIQAAMDDRVVAWVYGHTHLPQRVGKFYCNPIGYPGENPRHDINQIFSVSVAAVKESRRRVRRQHNGNVHRNST